MGTEDEEYFIHNYFDKKQGEALRKTITPNWESTAHHLKLLTVPESANKILEIGCGIGRLLKEIHVEKPSLRVCVGIDASQSMIDEGRQYCADRNIKLIKTSGEGNLGLTELEEFFDFAFSIVCFQHIPATNTVLTYISEMYRMLNTGGKIRFQVLSSDMGKGKLWTYHDISLLRSHMSGLGFNDICIEDLGVWAFFSASK